MLTTTIGAFPKPASVPITDWFSIADGDFTSRYAREVAAAGADVERLLDEATVQVVRQQVEVGIDVPTDGEIRRENYIHYQCRHLGGIDFDALTDVRMRGTTDARLPTITGTIRPGPSPLVRDYEVAQRATDRPVKMTLPGPMTIIDSVVDATYHDDAALAADLAAALNVAVVELANAGCTWIQIDEPVLARRPDAALEWGIDTLGRCFDGVGPGVRRVVHACCGYPNRIDQPDYPKAPPRSYLDLAEALDDAPIDQISIEDAHRHNDLADLLPRFPTTTVVLGVVTIASSRVEPVDEIEARLAAAAEIAPAGVIAAPDCGLGYLGRDLALTKLANLVAAAARL